MSNQTVNIKELISAEKERCRKDPVYFLKKYCFISHPQRGRIPFYLYPFQEKVLKLFLKNDKSIILKSRQLGLSTLVAGYSLWLMLFHDNKNILVVCTKTKTAKNLVTKVKFMWDGLPSWLQKEAGEDTKPEENNKLTLKLKNGSQIQAVSAAGDSGRSEAVSLLIVDEAAFINNAETIWTSAQQTLSTGGQGIVLSTPNGIGNWFHQTWAKAELGDNPFTPIRLPWYVHPERDQVWRDKQDEELGLKMAAQECDCDFATSGDGVFDNEALKLYDLNVIEPMEKRGADQNLWIWESPDYTKDYMVVADVARGDGSDYSAFHVFDIKEAAQVAEFKAQLGTKDFGNVLVNIATEYNDALLVCENASVGWAVIQQILERGYQNLYYSPKSGNAVDGYSAQYDNTANMVPGLTNSLKTRPLIVSAMEAYVREQSVTIRSARLIEEMRVFSWVNGKAQAQSGYNDDLVMSFAMGLFVRNTALKLRQQGIELTKQSITNMNKTSYDGIYNPSGYGISPQDTWRQDIGDGSQEDLRWLL